MQTNAIAHRHLFRSLGNKHIGDYLIIITHTYIRTGNIFSELPTLEQLSIAQGDPQSRGRRRGSPAQGSLSLGSVSFYMIF